jgi:hypothetical protein
MSMRTISTCAAVASLFVVFAACGPKQDPSAAQQPGMAPTATAPYGYPQQPGAYPTATGTAPYGYPQQGAPQQAYPTATAMPTAAPTAAPGQMAVPGPVAFQCTNDVPCGTHHCNTQYGKCAFPCQTNTDCITPNSCVMGLCVPQMPGAAPASH